MAAERIQSYRISRCSALLASLARSRGSVPDDTAMALGWLGDPTLFTAGQERMEIIYERLTPHAFRLKLSATPLPGSFLDQFKSTNWHQNMAERRPGKSLIGGGFSVVFDLRPDPVTAPVP